MPSRAERGVELYDFATNKMLVCGYGVVPRDCGVSMSKKLFVPRAGLAYRVTDSLVIRAGYGITNDPYNLLRPFRLNYPELINLNISAPNGFAPARWAVALPASRSTFSTAALCVPPKSPAWGHTSMIRCRPGWSAGSTLAFRSALSTHSRRRWASPGTTMATVFRPSSFPRTTN